VEQINARHEYRLTAGVSERRGILQTRIYSEQHCSQCWNSLAKLASANIFLGGHFGAIQFSGLKMNQKSPLTT
jgi:hypothetical protein